MYRNALILFAIAALLFTVVWRTQQHGASRVGDEYASLEKAMKQSLEAWQKAGNAKVKDPRADWQKIWRQFAERYAASDESSKAHVWVLSLMASANDGAGLADYLQVAVRYPNNPAVPAILNESVPLYLQAYGAGPTRESLSKIATASRNNDTQASVHFLLASLEDDDATKREALQQVQAAYPGTRASEDARSLIEDLKVVGVGAAAPQFEFTDLNGSKVSLQSFRGRWVLLDFWASWCPPCAEEIPAMKAIFAEFQADRSFAMLGISLDYEREALLETLNKQDMKWPQYMDGKGWDNKISRLYRVTVLPTTYLIDPEGVIRYRSKPGAELKKILAEKIG